MTAEEYLNSKKREHFYPGHTYYEVDLEAALKTVEMARNEGRKEVKQKQPASETQTDLRRQAAIAALQGYCANPNRMMYSCREIAELSVEQADELIKELGYESKEKDRF